MPNYFDALETRSADERESALATRLPQQIAHAKANAAYFGESLKNSMRRRSLRRRRWRPCRWCARVT
jgi:hypothetical protein